MLRRWNRFRTFSATAILPALGVIAFWWPKASDPIWTNPLAEARFRRLTDFDGSEYDAVV
jgi:hypothetical protein